MTFPELQQFFSQYSDIPPEEWTDFSTFVRTQFISRDESFISLGDTNGHIGFVVKGLFRVCYIDSDGGRFIRNFCAEGTLISAYTEALQEKPAEIEIQAIEHSKILFFKYSDYKKFFSRHHCWQEIARKLSEKYFSFREFREYQFLTKNAAERYSIFLKDFAQLTDRISQADVAAYIGVTPVSLSRILSSNKNKIKRNFND